VSVSVMALALPLARSISADLAGWVRIWSNCFLLGGSAWSAMRACRSTIDAFIVNATATAHCTRSAAQPSSTVVSCTTSDVWRAWLSARSAMRLSSWRSNVNSAASGWLVTSAICRCTRCASSGAAAGSWPTWRSPSSMSHMWLSQRSNQVSLRVLGAALLPPPPPFSRAWRRACTSL